MLVPSYAKYEELRKRAGITDYQVSKETGVTKSTFSEWKGERRNSRPKLDKLARIAAFFDVPIDYFLQDDQDEDAE